MKDATVAGPAAKLLGKYAVGLRWRGLPVDVLRQARSCVIDTVAAAVYGSDAPASRIAAAYARNGAGGDVPKDHSVLGGHVRLHRVSDSI